MILILVKYYYLKKGDDWYFIRYNDINKIKIIPLQLKIRIFMVNYMN